MIDRFLSCFEPRGQCICYGTENFHIILTMPLARQSSSDRGLLHACGTVRSVWFVVAALMDVKGDVAGPHPRPR
jgi:hypothetical protein